MEVSSISMDNTSIQERITLRKLGRGDLEFFFKWASDPEVTRWMTWEPYTSLIEAEKFLIEVAENHSWFNAICLDGVPVGSITLTQFKGASSCRAELGYVLAKSFWGQGIATVAVKQALSLAFNTLPLERIEALVDPTNIASQKVLVKAGMTCECLLKKYFVFKGAVSDRYMFSITR